MPQARPLPREAMARTRRESKHAESGSLEPAAKGKAWCLHQNARRAFERRRAGREVRAPKEPGLAGRKRARDAWSLRRSQKRLEAKRARCVASLRAARRSCIQERRRLYGKGPPPRFYIKQRELAPAATSISEPLLLQGSPCPSMLAECCSPPGVIATPARFLDEDEPLDATMLEMMDGLFDVKGPAVNVGKAEFRMLARWAGVPV